MGAKTFWCAQNEIGANGARKCASIEVLFELKRRPCKYSMNFYPLYALRSTTISNSKYSKYSRFKQLFPHKATQPRTFAKAFRASIGQRRLSLLFICHCAPRRFSIKRRSHFGKVFAFSLQHTTTLHAATARSCKRKQASSGRENSIVKQRCTQQPCTFLVVCCFPRATEHRTRMRTAQG